MIKTLKSQSLRAVFPRVLAALICAVVLFSLCFPGIIRVLGGASELSAETAEKGDYVRFDSMYTVVGFATLSNSLGEVSKTYYIFDLGGDRYAAMLADAKYDSFLSPALTQSELYYHSKTLDTLTSRGELRGTVKDMDSQLHSLMTQAMDSAELEGSIVPYVIEVGAVGFMSSTVLTVLVILAVAFLLWAAAELFLVYSGFYHKAALAAAGAGLSAQELEADFAAAQIFDHVHVGEKFVWFCLGARINCAKTADILWGFERIDGRMLGSRRFSLYLYLKNGDCLDIRTKTEAERKPIAQAVAEKGHPFLYGYSQERAGLFARDRAAFARMAAAEKQQ